MCSLSTLHFLFHLQVDTKFLIYAFAFFTLLWEEGRIRLKLLIAILKFSITKDLNKTEKATYDFKIQSKESCMCTCLCQHFCFWFFLNHIMASFCQIPTFSGFPVSPNGNIQMFPIMYPALVPGLISLQNQEQVNRGAGIYAVPVPPLMGPISGLPSNALIPLTYNIPT